MNELERGWVSGLLEGEGAFLIKQRAIGVVCGMTDEDTILRLHSIVGGTLDTPIDRPNRKRIYKWNLSVREDVLEFIKDIQPLMSERRSRRINELIQWDSENPKGRPRADKARHGSVTMYQTHKCRCDECKARMSEYRKEYKRRQNA